jgi:hypothetical protein
MALLQPVTALWVGVPLEYSQRTPSVSGSQLMIGATTYDGLLPYLDDGAAAGTRRVLPNAIVDAACLSTATIRLISAVMVAFHAASHAHGCSRARPPWRIL